MELGHHSHKEIDREAGSTKKDVQDHSQIEPPLAPLLVEPSRTQHGVKISHQCVLTIMHSIGMKAMVITFCLHAGFHI